MEQVVLFLIFENHVNMLIAQDPTENPNITAQNTFPTTVWHKPHDHFIAISLRLLMRSEGKISFATVAGCGSNK